MIEKTTGIVLRVAPFSKTSHVVVWFTPDLGKITTVVKGSQRVKSAFLGQYDLFYTCELLFYSRDRNGIHIMRECSPIDTRTALRSDWRAAVCASYSCDLVARMIPARIPSQQFFSLLETSLTFLCSGAVSRSFVSWFELKSMEAAGFTPRLSSCAKCGCMLAPASCESKFSCKMGGALCGACSKTCTDRSVHLTTAVLGRMKEWQQMDSPGDALRTDCTSRDLLKIEQVLSLFLDYHVQAISTGRAVALELLPLK